MGNSSIGLRVETEDLDLSTFQDGVTYRDNATNLDTITLPTPTIPDAISDGG